MTDKIPLPLVGTPAPTGEGRKDDSAKVRLELIPPELLFAVGEILSFGARKYADRNWERGMSWSRVFGALMRHMWCWWGGAQPTGKNFVFGDLDMLAEKLGRDHGAMAQDLRPRLKCSRCGSKNMSFIVRNYAGWDGAGGHSHS